MATRAAEVLQRRPSRAPPLALVAPAPSARSSAGPPAPVNSGLQKAQPMVTRTKNFMPASRTAAVRSDAPSFGARLKKLRTKLGLSVAELARQLNVTRQAVWKWERDEVRPRQASLEVLAQTLNAPDIAALRTQSDIGDVAPLISTPSSAVNPLPIVIDECKQSIAEAAGTTPEKVTILIEV